MVSGAQSSLPLSLLPPLITPYFDASVFLAHIKGEAIPAHRGRPRIEITNGLFSAAEQRKYKIHTSFFTWAEVRRLRESEKELTADELPKVNTLFTQYLENEWIVPIELSRAVGEKAQQLGAIYGMSPPDSVHLASALLAGCNVLLVWDKPTFLSRLPQSNTPGIHQIEQLQILEPYWEGVTPLSNTP